MEIYEAQAALQSAYFGTVVIEVVDFGHVHSDLCRKGKQFCQNVSFPNGTQFDKGRASSGLLRRSTSQRRKAAAILNLKS